MKIFKEYNILFILSLFIIMVTFYQVYDGYKIFVSGDTLSPVSLRNGINNITNISTTYPLWIPWIFSGMPSIHSFINISDCYYPHQLFLLLNNLGLPWVWNFLFHLIFGGIGMYALLRFLSCSKYASFFSSSLFMTLPYFIAMTVYGHGSQVMTACYIPWIILFIFKIYNKTNFINFSILALLIGFQLQRGHIQMAYYTWMLMGLFILINNIFYMKQNKINILRLFKYNLYPIISLIIGFIISLNLYIPALNYVQHSTRSGIGGGIGIEQATMWSFSFKESVTLLFPYFLGFGGKLYWGDMPFTDYPNYFGLLLILLAVYGFIKSKIKAEYKIFLFVTVLVSFLISLGSNFISFYKIFYYYLPFFNKFRVPVYILILFFFSMLIFAALGLDQFIKYLKDKSSNKKLYSIVIIFSFFIISIFIFQFLFPNFIPDINKNLLTKLIIKDIGIMIISVCILFMLILFFYFSKIASYKYFYILLTMLCLYDYLRVNHEIIDPKSHFPYKEIIKEKKYMNNYLLKDEIVNYLLEDTTKYRIYDAIGPPNRWGSHNIESVYGYHPAKLSNYNNLITEINNRGYTLWPESILEMLNVKYIILPTDKFKHSGFNIVKTGNMYYFGNDVRFDGKMIQSYIYESSKHFPRLYFTKKINYIDNDFIYNEILDESFDAIEASFLDSKYKDSFSFNYDPSSIVELVSWSPNKIQFRTKTSSQQFLIISEIFYPNGWILTDGTKEYDIYSVNGILRGAYIPKGVNTFTMYFDPVDVKYGRNISLISFISMLVILFIGIFKKRNYELFSK